MVVGILAAVLFSQTPPDSLRPWSFQHRGVLWAIASCALEDGEPTPGERLIDFCETLSISSGGFSAGASAAAFSDSSGGGDLSLRSAVMGARWPGTPWIGASLGYCDSQPLLSGMGMPLVDYGWVPPDSLTWFRGAVGGVLGSTVRAATCLAGPADTLFVASFDSPWLGLGAFSYTDLRRYSSDGLFSLSAASVTADFRWVEPWVIFVSEGGDSEHKAVLAEIRGIRLADLGTGRVEFAGSAVLAGDSASAPGGAFSQGDRLFGAELLLLPEERAVAGRVSAAIHADSLERSTGEVLLGMLSSGRLAVSGEVLGIGSGSGWSAGLSGDCRTGPASIGGSITATGRDSTRIEGRAGYIPRPDVSVFLSVSGDASGTLDPVGSLAAATWLG
ncbi:hypothetical protein GX411_03175, partial [Candidatus Fermentibacteria bacterium]|nr:hypothetical protein [Candidatus Fermentibacteria bacterium]